MLKLWMVAVSVVELILLQLATALVLRPAARSMLQVRCLRCNLQLHRPVCWWNQLHWFSHQQPVLDRLQNDYIFLHAVILKQLFQHALFQYVACDIARVGIKTAPINIFYHSLQFLTIIGVVNR